MKQIETVTSTGGMMTEYFDQQGQRQRVVHRAGRAYSGKMAQIEARERAAKNRVRKQLT